jgi:hypothetical protein
MDRGVYFRAVQKFEFYLVLKYDGDEVFKSANFEKTFNITKLKPIINASNISNLTADTSTYVNVNLNDDYVDVLIKEIQAAVLPTYSTANKMVDPPLVAIRFGNDIFCKGVITGDVSTTYDLPVLQNGKYAQVGFSFTMLEVDPYDANIVSKVGSFRGLDTSLERRLWKAAGRLF